MKLFQIMMISLIIASFPNANAQDEKPNILLITLDDMNWNSPASFGGKIPDLTPTIDRMVSEGIKFENAYVQAPNCSPSRIVIQTGLYPHQSGNRGFYYVEDNIKTLPELLKDNGYFTGIINKKADTSLSPDFYNYWDDSSGPNGKEKYSAKKYGELTLDFIAKTEQKKKPFYAVVNIADPHKPFFNDDVSQKKGFDDYEPSKIYTTDDVEVPEFLPETPIIQQQVLNYTNSVRRADDCIGAILAALNKSGVAKNTIVILLSDHGMPFPFAKSTVYQNGVKTPMVIMWPQKIKQASINSNDMVAAVDLAPTILEAAEISIPSHFAGASFYSSLFNENENPNQYVFAQYDENAGGIPRPSRTIISKQFGYIFNPWATGDYEFISAATYHPPYKEMRNLSSTNPEIGKRFEFWIHRTTEELYDYENDPNALNNLIDDPKYKDVLNALRAELLQHMEKTNDYVLNAFQNRENLNFLNSWMKGQIEEANERARTIQWKRYKNSNGPTKNNKQLYQVK